MRPPASIDELLEQLPFAIGTSPFRVKGVAYRGHVEYVEQHVPGGLAAQTEAFARPELGKFFEQKFLAASFYDVVPLAAAGFVCARLVGSTFSAFVRTRSQWQASKDIEGVYRVLLKLASAEMVARRLPKMVGQYFNFGEAVVTESQAGRVHGSLERVPGPLVPWYLGVIEPYVETALRTAGAREPKIKALTPRPQGVEAGIETFSVPYELSWG